jgi:predicted HTH transcriptional regulator
MSDVPFLEPPARLATDALPVRETSTDQIDMDAVARHLAEAARRGRYRGPDDPMAYLQSRACVITVGASTYLTLTGLLCFGRTPQELFPHAVIDLGHFGGRESISSDVVHLEKGIGGTVFQQLGRLEEYLWKNTHHGMTLSPTSMQRIELHEYPYPVIRELGVNMVAHRDYALYASVARVQLFRNRIEWISPGGLPAGLTIENILTEQRPRNPNIMRVLYEAGYVESFGQGLDTVVATLREEEMAPPEFRDTGASFIVCVYGRAQEVLQSGVMASELNDTQRLILTLIRAKGDVSPREIRALVPNRAERSLQRDIRSLQELGLITTSGGSRTLRYRPVEDESAED